MAQAAKQPFQSIELKHLDRGPTLFIGQPIRGLVDPTIWGLAKRDDELVEANLLGSQVSSFSNQLQGTLVALGGVGLRSFVPRLAVPRYRLQRIESSIMPA